MEHTLNLIQSQYELAMAIGSSLELAPMLHRSLTALMRVTNCPVGCVLFHEPKTGQDAFRQVFAIPRNVELVSGYQAAIKALEVLASPVENTDNWCRLSVIGQSADGMFFHLIGLPGLGAVILARKGTALDPVIVKSLVPMMAKLAGACQSCMQNSELLRHRDNLQQMLDELVERRTRELNEAKDTAERMARTDPLTGIANRRGFFERSNVAFNLSRRYGHALAVVIFDIDWFKCINDKYGHAAGDHVIISAARIAENCIRDSDIIGRLGGEEFAVVLPRATREDALPMVERIRKTMEGSAVIHDQHEINYTCSFGVSELCPDDKSLEDAVARADRSLYRAKESGRNKVVF